MFEECNRNVQFHEENIALNQSTTFDLYLWPRRSAVEAIIAELTHTHTGRSNLPFSTNRLTRDVSSFSYTNFTMIVWYSVECMSTRQLIADRFSNRYLVTCEDRSSAVLLLLSCETEVVGVLM